MYLKKCTLIPAVTFLNFNTRVHIKFIYQFISLLFLSVCDMADFNSLGLHEWLIKACNEMGFQTPTVVQNKCIPPIMKGMDCIASAETGSGKTAAFALPILHTLSEDPYGIYALIITPTRFEISTSLKNPNE